MDKITRIKKTGKVVYPVGKADSMHTFCLFPFGFVSKNGSRGVVQPVKNDNLITDRDSL